MHLRAVFKLYACTMITAKTFSRHNFQHCKYYNKSDRKIKKISLITYRRRDLKSILTSANYLQK